MSLSSARRLVAGLSLAVLLLAYPGVVGATIEGGCTGEGHSTSGGVNLTTDTVWHMRSTDVAGGSGTSPVPMRSASVGAYALGIQIPVAGGTSEDGKTAGSVDGISLATYAILGHRFIVAGSATGDGQCNGQIEVLIDDVDPLFTALGGGGIILALIGLLAMLLFARSEGGCLNRVLSSIFGGLTGVGIGLAGEQFEFLDPTQPLGLFLVVGLAIVGFVTCGALGGGEPAAPAAPAPPPAAPSPAPPPAGGPPTDDTQGFVNEVVAPGIDSTPAGVGSSASGGAGDAQMGGKASPGGDTLPPGGVGGGGPM
jgi:hypothetical protein